MTFLVHVYTQNEEHYLTYKLLVDYEKNHVWHARSMAILQGYKTSVFSLRTVIILSI